MENSIFQFPTQQLADDLSNKVIKNIENYFNSKTAAPATEQMFETRKDAAALLGISLPTLGEYTKTGIIKGYRIGSRVRYKRSELEAALIQIQSAKQGR